MPALFLARHYIELSLKDEIINVSIATGSNFIIGSKGNHSLIELSHSFKKLLENNYLNILHSKFFDIVETIAKLIVHSNISKKLDQSPKEKIIPEIENCVYSVIANNNLPSLKFKCNTNQLDLSD